MRHEKTIPPNSSVEKPMEEDAISPKLHTRTYRTVDSTSSTELAVTNRESPNCQNIFLQVSARRKHTHTQQSITICHTESQYHLHGVTHLETLLVLQVGWNLQDQRGSGISRASLAGRKIDLESVEKEKRKSIASPSRYERNYVTSRDARQRARAHPSITYSRNER